AQPRAGKPDTKPRLFVVGDVNKAERRQDAAQLRGLNICPRRIATRPRLHTPIVEQLLLLRYDKLCPDCPICRVQRTNPSHMAAQSRPRIIASILGPVAAACKENGTGLARCLALALAA